MGEYNYNFNNNDENKNVEGYNGFSTDSQQEPKKEKKHSFLKISAFVVAMGIVSAGSIEGYRIFSRENSLRSTSVTEETEEENKTTTKESKRESLASQAVSIIKPEAIGGSTLSTEEVVEKVLPSVVGVESTFTLEVQQSINPFSDFGFDGFDFGGFDFGYGNGRSGSSGTSEQEYKGTGTGVIISENGYIVTNAHVIYDNEYGAYEASSVSVLLDNEKSYDAEIIGYDIDCDLAVLKIDETGLTAAEFGNSDELKLGESVIAIGNPLGFDLMDTVTGGMISGLGRHITINNKAMNLIQTDAAINSGNSGGPLINKYGQVIGINSSKMSSSYGSSEASIEGIGFAIPSNATASIIDDLMKFGYVTGKAQLGITCRNVTETASKMYNLPVGVFVATVNEGSAAEKAGIKENDIIVSFNGQTIKSDSDLIAELNALSAGDKVEVILVRNGEEKTVEVTLEEKEPEKSKKNSKSEKDEDDSSDEEETTSKKHRSETDN
ncbi:MAG: trypsin-like peptidase domain-containing protein [Ruminococcus sp.]|uniref:S1C family serine protease n=1 Tax=Ruminococcus sp. TaxID=41978 RepID=UPI001B083B7F|nr:trypsin-like peptidase domain-containing protein [Ruminococcus sp.]MBO7474403.1 trypsin-like peptidase domain-containing protein [Ruminococcus sp.]